MVYFKYFDIKAQSSSGKVKASLIRPCRVSAAMCNDVLVLVCSRYAQVMKRRIKVLKETSGNASIFISYIIII